MQQFYDCQGTYNAIPRLWLNILLSTDSWVFTVVKQGRMAEFQEMLRLGKASLRDYDELGASLLFVSQVLHHSLHPLHKADGPKHANTQPDMCRFLLQHGADVDHVGGDIFGLGTTTATALLVRANDDDMDEFELKRTLTCRKLLLEAGCDPAVLVLRADGNDEEWSTLIDTFEFGVPVGITPCPDDMNTKFC